MTRDLFEVIADVTRGYLDEEQIHDVIDAVRAFHRPELARLRGIEARAQAIADAEPLSPAVREAARLILGDTP